MSGQSTQQQKAEPNGRQQNPSEIEIDASNWDAREDSGGWRPSLKILIGAALGVVVALLMSAWGWDFEGAATGGVGATVAFWWLSDAAAPAIPALLPIAALPLLGVLSLDDVGAAFGRPVIWLLLGGFAIALAIQNTGAHRRLALGLVSLVRRRSDSGAVVVAAFGVTAALISMWLVNTATTVMLVPVALAVCQSLPEEQRRMMEGPLLLVIAHAATIGGMATPVGTVPNALFLQQYELASGVQWGFVDWMSYGLPIVLLALPLLLLFMVRNVRQKAPDIPDVGAWRIEEKVALGALALAALIWVTRRQPFGGWSAWLDATWVSDGVIAIAVALLLFLIRIRGAPILKPADVAHLRWDVTLLMVGGLCLASALASTGISAVIAEPLKILGTLPTFVLILGICLLVTFLTEISSNTATILLFLPLLASVAAEIGLDPLVLMLPAAFSASCAFMMPVATPPNAIVAGISREAAHMMPRKGIVINFGMALLISVCIYFLI
ncbi:MAG: DASS family sodium-coupled anion symporter [Gammaproteobacteria bacterium AqS3]|nr:DASS family sodium-coupled anion symporter [Gammaproteobacteria bacterium AqS3]